MATNTNSEQYLLNEDVSFTQHFLPGLDAGLYQLQVEQQVFESDGVTPVSGDAYSNTYTFSVTGDRFSLSNPGNTINSVFPADNATGEFSNVLPHVVFTKTTFPWIRFPNLTPPTPPPIGGDVDADVPTWLWVMILDEDDVAANTGLNVTPANRTIGDLYPPAVVASSSLGTNYSYFNGATDLSALEPGQDTVNPIQTIDIPLSLFWQLAPSLTDLGYLAHGRTVSLINQTTSNSSVLGEPTGSFSIVFGNRLPNLEKKTYAFLVSLEELQNYLPGTGGVPPTSPVYPSTSLLRLAVLKNWTFYSSGESATFVQELQKLNGCVPGGPSATNTNLRLPYAGSNPVVAGALNMGYTPLSEIMRTAEKNVSWYRGPLVPYSIAAPSISLPIPSPDAATVFDPTTGMLDVSYSAAWTIGRMVALQDVSFSTSLYNWKKTVNAQIVNNLESALLAQEFSTAEEPPPGQTATATQTQTTSLFRHIALSLKKQ